VADKPDSHDICFIADGDTQKFLRERLGEQPGDIVDAGTGEVLGRHDGAYGFTVGQRKGLALTTPAADGRPRYVLSITPVNNTVSVGPAKALEVSTVEGARTVWTGGPRPDGPIECEVQVRAHGRPIPAVVSLHGDGMSVHLRQPERGIAAGQAVVVYQSDLVLGSATIVSAA